MGTNTSILKGFVAITVFSLWGVTAHAASEGSLALTKQKKLESLLKRTEVRAQRDAALSVLSGEGMKRSLELTAPLTKFSKRPAHRRSTGGISPASRDPLEYFVYSPTDFTEYDYVDNLDETWITYTAPSDADFISVSFDFVDLENSFDYISVRDAWGNECARLSGWLGVTDSTQCVGNVAQVRVHTDGSISGLDFNGDLLHYGFGISGYTYYVIPPNLPPTAIASANYYVLGAGETFQFNGALSYDSEPDDSIASFDWNFGDGSHSSSVNPTHTYSPGTYLVTLTVGDENGGYDSDSFYVVVESVADPMNISAVATQTSLQFFWGPGDNFTFGYRAGFIGGAGTHLSCGAATDIGNVTSKTYSSLIPGATYSVILCAYNSAHYNSPGKKYTIATRTLPAVGLPVRIDGIRKIAGGKVEITFKSAESGRLYQLQSKPDLNPSTLWTNAPGTALSSSVNQSLTNQVLAPSNGQAFYRIQVMP